MTAECVVDPLTHRWMEYRMGGVQLGPTQTTNSSTCPCCHLPINPTPVKIAAPMTLSYGSASHRHHAENRPFTVLGALQRFVAWFNQERGGVCFSSERRPVELVVLDTTHDHELHKSAMHHLQQSEEIELFLGPAMYEGEQFTQSAVELAGRIDVLVLAQGPVGSRSLQACHSCFSLFPPMRTIFEPVLGLLPSTGPGGLKLQLASLCGSDQVSQEACGALPTLVERHDMNLSRQVTLKYPYLESALEAARVMPEIDVFVVSVIDVTNGCYAIAHDVAAVDRGSDAVPLVAVVLAGPCTFDNSFFAFPELSGFVVGMSPWDWWANSASTAVDRSSRWSDAANFSQLLSDELDPLLRAEEGKMLASIVYAPLAPHLAIVEAHLIKQSRNPPAMLAWSALAILMSAVEGADSADAKNVAKYLQSYLGQNASLSTMLGQIAFDADGHATGSVSALQLQEVRSVFREPRVLNPRLAGGNSLARLVTPHPDAIDMDCFSQETDPSDKGFGEGATCQVCGADAVGIFLPEQKRRVCKKCPQGTSMHSIAAYRRGCRNCEGRMSCPAGSEMIDCVCQPCNPGLFSNESNNTACKPCVRGTFAVAAGSAYCDLCPAGKISGSGFAQCISCAAGTINSAAGQPHCSPCPAGTYAPKSGMTECRGCPEGRKSSWDGMECELCPAGKFQNVPNSSTCIDGEQGATYNSAGMAIGKNKEGFWVRVIGSQVTFERCLHGACLEEESCPKGSAGVQCASCLPGYVRPMPNMDKNCISCEVIIGGPWRRLALTVLFFLLFVWLGLWIAKLALERKQSPRDLTLAYVKMFILFLWISTVMGNTLQERLLGERGVLGETLTRLLVNAEAVSRGAVVDNAYASNLMHCLIQDSHLMDFLGQRGLNPASNQASRAIKVDTADGSDDFIFQKLQSLKHSEWFEPSSGPLISWLTDFQSSAQIGVVLGWIVMPAMSIVLAHVVCFIYVKLLVCKGRNFYNDAAKFYSDLVDCGVRIAIQRREAHQWLAYTSAYRSRIAMVWSPFMFRNAGFCASLREFRKTCTPFLQALFLLIYGFVLDGMVLVSKCTTFLNEDVDRVYFASELRCLDWERADTYLIVGAALCWILGGPLLISRKLYRLRQHITAGNEFEPADSVMTFGYRLNCWNWELYIFMLQAVILILRPAIEHPSTRGHVLLGVSLLHAGMVLSFQPYTNRSDCALLRADQRVALFFVMQCFIHEYIQYSQPDVGTQPDAAYILTEMTQARYTILVVASVLLNILMLLFFIFKFYEGFRNRFVEHYEEHEWILWAKNRNKAGWSGFGLLTTLIYKDYMRLREKQPYVCFDPDLGWVTTCGSQGHKAPLVRAHWGRMGMRDNLLDLSEAPSLPNESDVRVKVSTVEQRRKVIECLRLSLENLEAKSGTSGSILQLEFVLRAAFIFARDVELHSKRIARDPALLAAEERQVGMDALQLLMSSFGEEEEAAVSKLTSSIEEDDRGTLLARVTAVRSSRSTRTNLALSVEQRRTHSSQISKMLRQTTTSRSTLKKSQERPSWKNHLSKMFSCSSQRDAAMLELCEHFYDDPVRVLHFYSQAEFVRHEELDRIALEEWSHGNPSESIFTSIRLIVDNLRRRCHQAMVAFHTSNAHDAEQPVVRRTLGSMRHAISTLTEADAGEPDAEWCEGIVDQMFQDGMFATGLDLETLQLGLVLLETCQQQDIRFLQDKFHDRWYTSKYLTDHKIKSYKGFLQEKQVQCTSDTASGDTAEMRMERAAQRAEAATNRWHYIVLKLVGRNWAQVIMQILPSDMGTLLRARQQQPHKVKNGHP
eukprot:TRINITY_DN24117_c0_g2_i1.p1 TRINITY_DN24117_c0_g2~~TRINITY_DN24117_c0_g2_i1.p1  ORF type:complete len:2030 (-),score=293.27 TRINITY_DN24117_c0_g2_i1:106-5508(-)